MKESITSSHNTTTIGTTIHHNLTVSDRAQVCHILKDHYVKFLYPKAAHLDYHMNGTDLIFTAFLLEVQQDLNEAARHQASYLW